MNDSTRQPVAEWYADPTGRHELRYWDGNAWTDYVFSQGTRAVDPLVSKNDGDETERTMTAEIRGSGEQVPTASARRDQDQDQIEETSAQTSTPTKVPFFGARKVAQDAQEENARLRALLNEYGLMEIAQITEAKARLLREVDETRAELAVETDALREDRTTRDSIRKEVIDLRDSVQLQEFGLYDGGHVAESSVTLATELEALRTQIKHAVRNGDATTASTGFTFNNSTVKGDKFVRDMSKLMLRSYNAEAENCLKSVKAGNLPMAQKRLSTTVDQVERLGTMIDLHITPAYHRLRLRELELASRHLQALQVEKELERERRQELREQKQAEQELAREREKLDKERSHYSNVLATLLAKGDEEGADRMRAQLAEVEHAIENVDSRAANIKAGYVYVISNIGAFGPDVVKIGMTRRLDPMDRVNELGDASVPFRFDVHALFFADNALSIESMLHQHFAGRRLNRVNLRREYFHATPAEVLEVLTSHNVEVLEYVVEPTAAEYRSSLIEQDT